MVLGWCARKTSEPYSCYSLCLCCLLFSWEQQGKTALGVAARADEVIIVDMIIKAERYFAWKVMLIAILHS